jgi:transcriptional regulator GlxA family with amidase domain
MDLREPLDRAADATTVPDLLLVYRRAVLDVQEAVLHPKQAHHDRSVRRATAFVRGHLDEPLSLTRVARVAGFAPTYFSSIFAKTEKTTLARYIRRLRVDRAKKMLDSTVLGVERIGQLCGFRTRTSFHHAFHELVGSTPGDYRARARRSR